LDWTLSAGLELFLLDSLICESGGMSAKIFEVGLDEPTMVISSSAARMMTPHRARIGADEKDDLDRTGNRQPTAEVYVE
jgi:hypothetical protein